MKKYLTAGILSVLAGRFSVWVVEPKDPTVVVVSWVSITLMWFLSQLVLIDIDENKYKYDRRGEKEYTKDC